MFSPLELAVVGLLVVLLFGTRRLPELGTGVGKAISNFKKSYREGTEIDVTPQAQKDAKSSGSDEPKAS
jgi:sec-independent protein translocase protein TatA